MKRVVCLTGMLAAVAVLTLGYGDVSAQEKLRLAVGQRGNWETAVSELGQRAGIFKKRGLDLEILYTQGAGETLQVVISGAADIGIGVGTSGVMGAYAKGAPVRAIGSATTGSNDLYWYVRTDSPLKSLREATDQTTIAYSTRGSSTNSLVLGFLKHFDIKAKPVATGNPVSTFTQVMSGQVDVGWAAPPIGLQAIEEGKIRIIARGSDVPSTRDQTVRLLIANADTLAKRGDVYARYMQAYRESLDWMYSDPRALTYYREFSNIPEHLTRKAMQEFYHQEALDPDRISGLDSIMADAVTLKFLPSPLSKAQLAELFQVPKPIK